MAYWNGTMAEEGLSFYSQIILNVKSGGFPIMQTDAISTKRNHKGSKRRLRLLMILMLCFMSWAGVTIFSQFGKLHAKSLSVKELQTQLENVKKNNTDTKREITRLNDKEYIEQKIRQDLHYTKPGETIFFAPKTNP
jgi:cell division protein DivIC